MLMTCVWVLVYHTHAVPCKNITLTLSPSRMVSRSASRSPPRKKESSRREESPKRARRDRSRSESPKRRRDRSRSRSGGRGKPGNKEGKRQTGIAARWQDRGFGFIKPDEGGDDLFCHVSAIRDGNMLEEGAKVEFDCVYDDRKQKSL
jgi:cold shock CspA family protein